MEKLLMYFCGQSTYSTVLGGENTTVCVLHMIHKK